MENDSKQLKAQLLDRMPALAQHLYPQGHLDGNNWRVGDVTGSPGQSFGICISGEKRGLWSDFSSGDKASRSPIDLWRAARGVDTATAFREARAWLGMPSTNESHVSKQAVSTGAGERFDWRQCVANLKLNHLLLLAKTRGYSNPFCGWLRKEGLVGLYEDCIAWPLRDAVGTIVAAHYKLRWDDPRSWRVSPSGSKMSPFVIGNPAAAKIVHVSESTWDLLAVCDALGLHEDQRVALIATRGAANGNGIAGLIPRGCEVFIWLQNDEKRSSKTGKTPAEMWLAEVCKHVSDGAKVVKVPAQFKDLNDWRRLGNATVDDLQLQLERATIAAVPVQPEGASANTPPQAAGADDFECYYDLARKEYLVRNGRGIWLSLNESQFKRVLRKHGFSTRATDGERLSGIDQKILDTQNQHDVSYAGPLAGYRAGFHQDGDLRIVVTSPPKLIVPMDGHWSTIAKFMSGLFMDDSVDQQPFVYGWLKIAYEALLAGEIRPGQALVIAGEHGCGKSLFQTIITEILGGRFAKPYQFMSGATQFNSDLFEAEHLMIEDEQSSTRGDTRRFFGSQIKQFTAADGQRCHAKQRVALSLKPFWRLTISVNREPENLMVLPPIDESIEDKLILLRASKNAMPMPTATGEQRKLFMQKIKGELPAFLAHLIAWKIPADLVCERFGIRHFHHPEILQAIDTLSPEFRLLALIDSEIFDNPITSEWSGTAEELERRLCSSESRCRSEAQRLLTYNTACGVFLGRLLKKVGERITFQRHRDRRIWTIQPKE
jgi:hypothetical protein